MTKKSMKALVLILTIIGAATTEASAPAAPQFRVSVDKGIITLRDVNNGKILGKTTFERLGVVAPTQDELRHVAPDVTAAVVAGNGSRKRTVGPSARVYTLAEKDKAPYVTGTFEHGAVFVLLSDTQLDGRYEALIYVVKIRRIAEASA
jgi:hypothetical protein